MAISRISRVESSVAGFGVALTHDLANGAPAARQFFPAIDWLDVVRQIQARTHPRRELAGVLEQSALRFRAPEAVFENIRLLERPETFVVATGQQAGFLGGPLYTLHKALSAISLARQLTREAGGAARFVPLFWVAGDDHDLGEIDHAYLLKSDGELLRARAPLTAQSQGCSACDAFMDTSAENIDLLRTELSQVLPDDFAAKHLEFYRERSVSDAFSALLYQWLGEHGLILAQSQEMRSFGKEILARELDDYGVTARLIQEAGTALRGCGYQPGFPEGHQRGPHFFIASEPSRIRAHLDAVEKRGAARFRERSAAFAERDQQPRMFAKAELAALIAQRPQLFSPAAALRPVVQQGIFPVAAAVLGPGEIAYWAHLRKVHEHFGVVFPLVVPRASLTLLDGRGQKAARKLGLQQWPEEIFKDPSALEEKLLRGDAVLRVIHEKSASVLAAFDAISAEVLAADVGLQSLFAKSRERIEHELRRIAEKTQASAEQREGSQAGRLRYLLSLVRPKNLPQERVLAAAQFMAAVPSLAGELLNAISPLSREHLIVELE